MTVDWWAVSLFNVVYSTAVLGGIVWFKVRRLRREVHQVLEALERLAPPVPMGETFLKEELQEIHLTLREYHARLSDLETRVDRQVERPTR